MGKVFFRITFSWSCGHNGCNSDNKLIEGSSINYFFILLDLLLRNSYSREGNGTPLQYSCLENPTGRVAWGAAVHGVARSRTRLSNFTFTFPFHPLEKEMATHSSVLAWRIPGTGEPGGLPSLGSQSRTRLRRLSSSSSSSNKGHRASQGA